MIERHTYNGIPTPPYKEAAPEKQIVMYDKCERCIHKNVCGKDAACEFLDEKIVKAGLSIFNAIEDAARNNACDPGAILESMKATSACFGKKDN